MYKIKISEWQRGHIEEALRFMGDQIIMSTLPGTGDPMQTRYRTEYDEYNALTRLIGAVPALEKTGPGEIHSLCE